MSPIRVLNADMFATPLKSFDLPSYAAELANVMAVAPSPSPSPPRHLINEVSAYVDIEAEEGEDSDRLGSPSC